ncbi:EEF1A lysine methyltransferase 1 [Actinomortierella ambigua]|uniref:Protein-lysine N-methyltransferase EFM5 n=1 Tax=Actinomortierella ambigua TaxID=1343610 RepID=A0A9P6U9D1_9FUNG|nr:EEF1A lysine methyltransferase 1 [Actinomortierella ambigua]
MDSDDELQLSTSTLSVLQEFLKEQQASQEKFARLQAKAEDQFEENRINGDYDEEAEREEAIRGAEEAERRANAQDGKGDNDDDDDEITMDLFTEDWQLSQFWYDEETSVALAQEILDNTDKNSVIACISAPTAYVKLMSLKPHNKANTYLFEYDTRFGVYGKQFIHYDYSNPTQFRLADKLKGKVDYIVVDPPFLSDECCDKTLSTVRNLLNPNGGKVLMCTGFVMRSRVLDNIGAKMTTFHPKHKGGLSNEFRSYTNYESKHMPWSTEDA